MELSEHIITNIECRKVRTRLPRMAVKNAYIPAHYYGIDLILVILTTNHGVKGFGIGQYSRPMVAALKGRRVSDVFDPSVGILESVLFPADLALHDLAGKILGIPVKKMISETTRDAVECYDGAIYMNDISPDGVVGDIDTIINDCRYDYDVLGYRDFKVKVGRGFKWMDPEEGLKRDIDVIHAIRKNFPDSRIMFDANDAFTVETTMRYMDAIKDCGIYWIEEPFKENKDDLKILKEYLAKNSPNTLIADGEWAPEYIHTAETIGLLEELAKEKLIDVFLMDTYEFGFTNWRKYMNTIKKLGVKASPHGWATMLKSIYASHLSAAYGPGLVETLEGAGDTIEGVDISKCSINNGMLTVPDAPGFGVDFIWGSRI